jgi:molybdate transport system substrate-binding protein
MNMRTLSRHLISLGLLVISTCALAEEKITLFAAASLTNAVGEVAALYEKEKSVKVTGSYAASSTLAKQIENGAPADVFISADLKWMNYLQLKQKTLPETRKNLLGNKLVLIAPVGKGFKVVPDQSFDLSKAFDGRLCTGDLESVPVGIYAKQSLTALNWWNSIKSRIVGTQDVRAALAFVERGECAAGIVYETDARISSKVEIIASLPDDSHDAIVYPVVAVAGAKPEGKAFVDYLSTPAATAIFVKYGFTPIRK